MDLNKQLTVEEYCQKSLEISNQRETVENFSHRIGNILNSIADCFDVGHFDINILNRCILNKDSELNILEKEWSETIAHTIRPQFHKSKHIFMRSYGKFKLDEFIFKFCNFRVHHNSINSKMQFGKDDSFLMLCKQELAMVWCKYGQLYKFEVAMIVIRVLFEYYRIYTYTDKDKEKKYICHVSKDIFNMVYNCTLATPYETMAPYFQRIDCFGEKEPTTAFIRTDKPNTAEEILSLKTPGMSQKQLIQAVIDNYDGVNSIATARRIIAKLGLSDKKKCRKGYIKDSGEVTTEAPAEVPAATDKQEEDSVEVWKNRYYDMKRERDLLESGYKELLYQVRELASTGDLETLKRL